jgi:hypothetical protein
MNYSTSINITGTAKRQKFKVTKEFLSGENENFYSVFCVTALSERYGTDELQDTIDVKMNKRKKTSGTCQKRFTSSCSNLRKRKIWLLDHDGNLESRTSKEEDRSLQAEGSSTNFSQEHSGIGTAMPVVRTVNG